jgi:hypothetical protein
MRRDSLLVAVAAASAQDGDRTFPTPTIQLWEKGAPGALGNEDRDHPTLTLYPTFRETIGTAVIIAPGGSYQGLAQNLEGRQVANWFNAIGVTAFLLKYRLGPRYHHPIELGDAQRAIRLVRTRAKEFGINPNRIGIIGFSAGGHLASTAGTHFDAGNRRLRMRCRASCGRIFSFWLSVISLTASYTHERSKEPAGRSPTRNCSAIFQHTQVTPQTPPTF